MESELSTLTSELLSRLPTITGEEQRLGLEIYRQLARGEPVSRAELARALEASTDTVEELLGRPNLKSLTYADEGGQIIGFGGLAVREMPHRFKVDSRTLYTWCAWDSLFIPVILGAAAEVESPVPGSSARVRLSVAPDGVKRLQPRTAVMCCSCRALRPFRQTPSRRSRAFATTSSSSQIGTQLRPGRRAIPTRRSSQCQTPSSSAAGWLAHGGRTTRPDRNRHRLGWVGAGVPVPESRLARRRCG